jgi:hypothetical protein
MGSSGIKRRKTRHRLPPTGQGSEAQGWELRNSPYTFEGEIEGLSRFGRGVSSMSPTQRRVGIVIVAAFCGPLAIGLVYAAINAVR